MLKRAGLAKTTMAIREIPSGPDVAKPGVDLWLTHFGIELSRRDRYGWSDHTARPSLQQAARRPWRADVEAIRVEGTRGLRCKCC
jgi:hypothetical protein